LWTPLAAQHHRHPKMIELLERHGVSGPHAFTVLLCEAGAGIHGRHERGVAEMSWREFSSFAGVELNVTRDRLHELAAEPFTLVDVEHEDALGFRVRLVRWAEWDQQPKDRTAAERAQRYRDRQRDARDASVTGRDDHTQDTYTDTYRTLGKGSDVFRRSANESADDVAGRA
jgi:hypothetical protein